MESHSVSRLIGAPPGYVGYDVGGQLTEVVRKHPYCVILFDEIEKAHSQVLNILLQLLDDGRLTDGKGRTVDFSNTVVIMTSNVGSQYLTQPNNPQAHPQVMQLVRQSFKPELLNRITDIIIFDPLKKEQLFKIVRIQLADVAKRLKDKNIDLILTDKAADYILDQAYDPSYGARPLKRYLERMLVTELAKLIVSGTLQELSNVFIERKGESAGVCHKVNDELVVRIELKTDMDLDNE
jgi:ATP-dependent Clp protease ATP-binding subunit ClpB